MRNIDSFLIVLAAAWVFGWLGWSVLWLILLGIAIWKARQRELEGGWRVFYRNAERKRKHQIVCIFIVYSWVCACMCIVPACVWQREL